MLRSACSRSSGGALQVPIGHPQVQVGRTHSEAAKMATESSEPPRRPTKASEIRDKAYDREALAIRGAASWKILDDSGTRGAGGVRLM